MSSKKEKQTLKPLSAELRSIVRSGIAITTLTQCVEELVYNSIDAKADNIHIGVNLDHFHVRVEDDGIGLHEADLETVGVRYTTSKCSSIADLQNLTYYGFRGEALASIVDVSNTVDIITRPKSSTGVELKKKFADGKAKGFVEKYNTSSKKSGTTIVVGNLLSRIPVRQQRIDLKVQFEEIKEALETISLINPKLNIELRNEKNGTVVFKFTPSSCYSDALNQMFKARIGFEVKLVQEHFLHHQFFFNISVSDDFVKRKHYQFVFVNNRVVRRRKIHKWVANSILGRSKDCTSPKVENYPIFILNITCPFSEYDITLEPKKERVEFRDWDAVSSGIDGLMLKLKHKNSFACVIKSTEPVDKNTSLISSYDVKGALHSRFIARKIDIPTTSANSSLTDSDRGSFGRGYPAKVNQKDTSRRDRNVTRTGHSTHVVNVREIRKKNKRKWENNIVVSKPVPVPQKPTLNAPVSKPNLTLGAFNKFPEWNGEFDKSAPPPKRPRAINQENNKYYVSDVGSNNQSNQTTEEQLSESHNFEWKINRYLQSYQKGAAVPEEEEIAAGESWNTKNLLSRIPSPGSIATTSSKDITSVGRKSQLTSYSDVRDFVVGTSEVFLNNHFKDKWTAKNVKESIIKRLFKYYKRTKALDAKLKIDLTPTNARNGNPVDSNSAVSAPCGNKRLLPSPTKNSTTPCGYVTPVDRLIGSGQIINVEAPKYLTKKRMKSEASEQSLVKTNTDVKLGSDNNISRNSKENLNESSYLPTKKPPTAEDQATIVPPFCFLNTTLPTTAERQANIMPSLNAHVFQRPSLEIPLFKECNSNKPWADFKDNRDSMSNVSISSLVPVATANSSMHFENNQCISNLQEKKNSAGILGNTDMENGMGAQPTFSNMLPFVKPQKLEFFKLNQDEGARSETNSVHVPPLLDLFPIQKSVSSDWNDKMMSDNYSDVDDGLFPSDWTAEILLDEKGQEWLQTLDSTGKNIYINLTSGESSCNIGQVRGSLRKVSAGEMKKSNPVRFSWLKKHFPRGFKRFWNGDTREIVKEGDLRKLNNSAIGDSLLKRINLQTNDQLSKWTDNELQNVSKYFSSSVDSKPKTIHNNATTTGIQCWKKVGNTTSSFRLEREDFELIRVIGNYDKKFILAGIRKSSTEAETLVIFDQHAVHERIRLEQLIKESFLSTNSAIKYLKGAEVMPPYSIPLSETEVRIMLNYLEFFRQAAIKFETVSSSAVKIKSVPKCFLEKCMNEPAASREETFRNLVHNLIQELIHTIMETKVATLSGLPKTVHSVLCSQACHGAIKFGDELDLDVCKMLILDLRSCKNPFQCAHGRPSVVPLLKGQDMLKVSVAGYKNAQERQLCSSSNACLPFHDECSKFFCVPKPNEDETSPYFKFDNFSIPPKPVNLFSPPTFTNFENQQKNESTTSDFFSFLSERQSDVVDNQMSSYFNGIP